MQSNCPFSVLVQKLGIVILTACSLMLTIPSFGRRVETACSLVFIFIHIVYARLDIIAVHRYYARLFSQGHQKQSYFQVEIPPLPGHMMMFST